MFTVNPDRFGSELSTEWLPQPWPALLAGWEMLKLYGRIEYSHDFAGSAHTRLGYANLPELLSYGIDVDGSSTDSIRLNSASTPTFGG